MNPLLPPGTFVPDAEARAWSDGRLYLYGSLDIEGNTAYCSCEYKVFSSGDLKQWTDHGVSFRSRGEASGVPWSEMPLYAPDCICVDGKYYLYFCQADNGEGVAVGDAPQGPFADAVPVQGAHGDAIDPAVFLDDDGQVYYYWGQFHARGARMRADLASLDAASVRSHLLNEAEHGFHEGASVRKRNGIYYLVYTDTSRGKATCLSYATSASPLGPFTKGGVIVDNDGCDPHTWNNHGSIAEWDGRWYVFYHRSSRGSPYSRRVCVEPIHFNADGSIPEVEMTTQGAFGPISAFERMDAYRACLLAGNARTQSSELPVAVEGPPAEFLSMIEDGAWAAYKYLDFGHGAVSFEVQAASMTEGGDIEVRLDRFDGPLIGKCSVSRTGGWQRWRTFACEVSAEGGVHALYLVFRGGPGRLFNVSGFRFHVGEGTR